MITPSGEVKVMDFGIARALTGAGGGTTTGTVLGTAAYLSPEQAESRPVDPRSDVYSLGVVLYEMLAGRPPFQGETAVAVAYKHVGEQPTPPSRHNRAIPAPVEAVVMRALAKDPADRYQSADELRADLVRARAGEEVAAGPSVSATAPIGTTDAGTMAMPAAPPTHVWEDPLVTGGMEGPRRRRWPLVAVLVAVIAGAALAAALVAGAGGPSAVPAVRRSPTHHPKPSPSAPHSAAPSSAPSAVPSAAPSPSPLPSPSPRPPHTVAPSPPPSPASIPSPPAPASPAPVNSVLPPI
jgi:serine/threonine-protein kinase